MALRMDVLLRWSAAPAGDSAPPWSALVPIVSRPARAATAARVGQAFQPDRERQAGKPDLRKLPTLAPAARLAWTPAPAGRYEPRHAIGSPPSAPVRPAPGPAPRGRPGGASGGNARRPPAGAAAGLAAALR